MIKLVQNSVTIRKGSLNFMDQNGKVVGFNPRPDGNPLSFYVYTASGEMLDTNGKFIEEYLDGLPYCFGNDGHIIKHGAVSDDDDRLVISLVPDGANEPLVLHIVCLNSLYYTANFVLSEQDRMLFNMPPADSGSESSAELEEISRVMAELVHVRAQVSQALIDLGSLKKKIFAKTAKEE